MSVALRERIGLRVLNCLARSASRRLSQHAYGAAARQRLDWYRRRDAAPQTDRTVLLWRELAERKTPGLPIRGGYAHVSWMRRGDPGLPPLPRGALWRDPRRRKLGCGSSPRGFAGRRTAGSDGALRRGAAGRASDAGCEPTVRAGACARALVGLAGPYDFFPFTEADHWDLFAPKDEYPASQAVNFVRPDAAPLYLLHGAEDQRVRRGIRRA